MKHSPWILVLVIGVLALPHTASAQSYAPSAERGAELLAELGLRAEQQTKADGLLAAARKQAIRSKADIEIAGIDLLLELAKDSPNEKVAGQLIEKMSTLEGQRVRSRVVAWLKIRKLLNSKQRRELRRLRNAGGSNIVKTQGVFINPFDDFEAQEPSRGSDDIENPFAQPRRRPPGLASPNARGRLGISTSSPARIYVDGKLRGQSPVNLRLAVGKHRLRMVFLDGSPTQRRTVNVRKSQITQIHGVAGSAASESPFNPYQ